MIDHGTAICVMKVELADYHDGDLYFAMSGTYNDVCDATGIKLYLTKNIKEAYQFARTDNKDVLIAVQGIIELIDSNTTFYNSYFPSHYGNITVFEDKVIGYVGEILNLPKRYL